MEIGVPNKYRALQFICRLCVTDKKGKKHLATRLCDNGICSQKDFYQTNVWTLRCTPLTWKVFQAMLFQEGVQVRF